MLEVKALSAGYGRARVLYDVSLEARAGEVVALLGRNGAGKSTTLKALMGLVERTGEVRFDGNPIGGLEPHEIARLGLGYVPEDRRIFTDLTVAENLEVGRRAPRPGLPAWDEARLFTLFPNLASMRDRPGALLTRHFVASPGTPRHVALVELPRESRLPAQQPGWVMRLYRAYGA